MLSSGVSNQTCQVIDTSGTAIQPYPNLTGYTCTCGVWVQYGIYHQCLNWQQQYIPSVSWNWSSMPAISAFRGAVKALKDLPKTGAIGEAYYVTSEDLLVVRQTGGWFHFDKK